MKRFLPLLLLAVVLLPVSSHAEVLPPYLEAAQVESIRLRIETFERRIAEAQQRIRDTIERKKSEETELIEDSYQQVVEELYDKARQRRTTLIDRMEQFLERNGESHLAADTMLRLGELYFERANDDFIRLMTEYEQQLDAFYRGEISEEPPFPDTNHAASIALYKEFIERFPEHPKIEEALYLLGYTLRDEYRGDEALEYFAKLIEMRPDSKFAPEVTFRIGEFLFEIGEFENAIEQYKKTLTFNDAMLHDKALYKLGWAYYRLNRLDDANRYFVDVLDYGVTHDLPESAMRQEAIQYIGISFSDEGGLEALEEMLEALGNPPYALELVSGFADVLFDQTRHMEAIEAYFRVTELFPLQPNNPEILLKVMDTFQRLALLEEAFEVRERLVTEYGPRSAWYRHYAGSATEPARDAALAEETRQMTEKLLYEYARYVHARAQAMEGDGDGSAEAAARQAGMELTEDAIEETVDRSDRAARPARAGEAEADETIAARYYARAAESYARFLDLFPESRKGAEAGFMLAEILYTQERWEAAGARYRGVTQDLASPGNQYFTDAAWNMVLSYRNALEAFEDTYEGRRAVGYFETLMELGGRRVTEATLAAMGPRPPFPDEAQRLLDATRYYTDLFPQSERNALLLYADGQLYLQYGENKRARAVFDTFLERYPTHELMFDALRSVVLTFTLEREFGALNEYAYEVLDSNLGLHEEVGPYFGGILAGSIFKDAQTQEEEGDLLRAAATYQSLVEQFPESEHAPDALFNTALLFEREGRYYESISVYQRLMETFPDSDYVRKAVFSIARNNERVMNYTGAVRYYLKLAREFPDEEEGPDAVYNSALLLEKTGDLERAAAVYLEYVNRYGDRDDVAEVLFFAGDMYYQNEDWENAAAVYENYARGPYEPKDLLVEAYYKWAMSEKNAGNEERSRQLLMATRRAYDDVTADGTAVPPAFGAHGAFLEAEEAYAEYEALQLELPMDRMAALLEQKAALLQKMVANFTRVVQYGDPAWSSAALYMIGAAYQNFANTLFDAPVPEELDEFEAEMYMFELQDQAFPIEDRALRAFERQLDTAARHGIDNEWTEKTREQLRALNPNLERPKAAEMFVMGRNEFFYTFGPTTERHAEYEILEGRVLYADAVEDVTAEDEEQVVLTRAQDRILKRSTAPALFLSGDGIAMEAPDNLRMVDETGR